MSVASIGTNGNSNWARYGVASVERDLDRAMMQLSTGKRTSSSAIDAAGIGQASKLEAEMRGFKMAARSAFDAATAALAADALLDEVMDIKQRQRELAVQHASSTLTTAQKTLITTEITDLGTATTALLASGTWNTKTLNNLSANAAVGQDGGSAIVVSSGATIAATTGTTVTTYDTDMNTIATARGKLGAAANAATHAGEQQLALAAAASEGLSRVQDTDYAQATAELARAQIVQQAAMAMVAQANQQPSTVLALLR